MVDHRFLAVHLFFRHRFRAKVRGFADGHEVIKISMKQDRSNAASLAKMEQKLRELGNHGAANRLAGSPVASLLEVFGQ